MFCFLLKVILKIAKILGWFPYTFKISNENTFEIKKNIFRKIFSIVVHLLLYIYIFCFLFWYYINWPLISNGCTVDIYWKVTNIISIISCVLFSIFGYFKSEHLRRLIKFYTKLVKRFQIKYKVTNGINVILLFSLTYVCVIEVLDLYNLFKKRYLDEVLLRVLFNYTNFSSSVALYIFNCFSSISYSIFEIIEERIDMNKVFNQKMTTSTFTNGFNFSNNKLKSPIKILTKLFLFHEEFLNYITIPICLVLLKVIFCLILQIFNISSFGITLSVSFLHSFSYLVYSNIYFLPLLFHPTLAMHSVSIYILN